ncbi:uncharacterized protein MKZ38_003196 [Zalerion maritima]|uniref:F-box domain-containing protein n=1 Tax=Zalerion maritima TaxID=339359 RepID=A0AAD5S0F6_9PEZI|nr:uncharacterized protein MKZ38_003196 [Zalerion maritima]
MGSAAEAEPTAAATATATATTQPEAPALSITPPHHVPKEPRTFLDLPVETQKEIFNHCAQCDLICLSLVNKHFRELSASQLYRNFHIVFPDEDDPQFDSPIDGLAGGLDTFVTSDYNYAGHLRDLSLDTLSAGDKAESAYKNYLYSSSCGKFMNTLLLMTLKKSKSLESFRWNIRVELSRPVYKALHNIPTLRDLHIRMQVGESLYSPPPLLPYNSYQHLLPSWSNQEPVQPVVSSIVPLGLPPLPFSLDVGSNSTTASTLVGTTITHQITEPNSASVSIPKPSTKSGKKPQSGEPPTLSGFKNLKTIAVLDIDSLDILDEMAACVQNSSSSLTKLKLSFSDSLASAARKPPPDSDPNNESDEDDEFQMPVPGNQHIPDDMTGPARAFRAAQMRKRQEAVLGKVFGITEPKKPAEDTAKAEVKEESLDDKEQAEDGAETANAGQEYITSIKDVAEKLMFKLGKAEQEEVLQTIIKASKQYVKTQKESPSEETGEQAQQRQPIKGTSEAGESPSSSGTANGAGTPTTGSVFNSPRKETRKDSTAEAIDIEEPLEHLSLESESDDKDAEPESEDNNNMHGTTATASESSEKGAEETEVQEPKSVDEPVIAQEGQRPLRTVKKNIQEAKEYLENTKDGQSARDTIAEYVRSTRGIGLKSFSLHQIPIKAGILTKSLDFRSIKRITLLNVGNQAPLWAALTKLNRVEPLPLVKIFTDNVSTQFVTLVSGLKELHELFMLERAHKHKPENLAPKTTVGIADIRKHILKTHLPHLKRLMIKNDTIPGHDHHDPNGGNVSWDVDEKTMLLLCRKAKVLQELSISAGIKSIHTMVQHIGNLANLRALHIQKFRNEDTCMWVMRETRRFVRDNLTHYPHLKLEFLCIDDERVDRILRHAPEEENAKADKEKEKEKANTNGTSITGPSYPMLSTANLADGNNSDSDSEAGDRDIQDMTLELFESMQFYDIWGVRIFKKEVMAGRL